MATRPIAARPPEGHRADQPRHIPAGTRESEPRGNGAFRLVVTLLALGLSAWLLLSPWLLDYPYGDPRSDAFLNHALVALVLGSAGVAYELSAGRLRRLPPVVILAGAWLTAVPRLFDFGDTATTNAMVSGVGVMLLGVTMVGTAVPRRRSPRDG